MSTSDTFDENIYYLYRKLDTRFAAYLPMCTAVIKQRPAKASKRQPGSVPTRRFDALAGRLLVPIW